MSKSKNYFQTKKPAASFATALAFALALLLAFPKNAAAQADINFWSDYPNEELADALVSRMSDEELYSRLGMVIGHEISHAFDSAGAQFDKDGNMNMWWNES